MTAFLMMKIKTENILMHKNISINKINNNYNCHYR